MSNQALNEPYGLFGKPFLFKDVIVAGVRLTLRATNINGPWYLPRQKEAITTLPAPVVERDRQFIVPNDEKLIKQAHSKKIVRNSGPDKPLRKKYKEIEQKAALIAMYPNGKNCEPLPNTDGGPLYAKPVAKD